MISQRLFALLAGGVLTLGLSACGSKPTPAPVATGPQEFDPYSNSWRASNRIVTPPPSQPNQALAEQQEAAAREDSTLNRAGRAVGSTADAVGRAVKKPLEWLPFGKKEEAPAEEVQPAVPVQ